MYIGDGVLVFRVIEIWSHILGYGNLWGSKKLLHSFWTECVYIGGQSFPTSIGSTVPIPFIET